MIGSWSVSGCVLRGVSPLIVRTIEVGDRYKSGEGISG